MEDLRVVWVHLLGVRLARLTHVFEIVHALVDKTLVQGRLRVHYREVGEVALIALVHSRLQIFAKDVLLTTVNSTFVRRRVKRLRFTVHVVCIQRLVRAARVGVFVAHGRVRVERVPLALRLHLLLGEVDRGTHALVLTQVDVAVRVFVEHLGAVVVVSILRGGRSRLRQQRHTLPFAVQTRQHVFGNACICRIEVTRLAREVAARTSCVCIGVRLARGREEVRRVQQPRRRVLHPSGGVERAVRGVVVVGVVGIVRDTVLYLHRRSVLREARAEYVDVIGCFGAFQTGEVGVVDEFGFVVGYFFVYVYVHCLS